jgi:predicted DNA binding protein
MEIHFYPEDLAEEFKDGTSAAISARDVDYWKLSPKAQRVLRAAGRATYYDWDRSYNALYPPRNVLDDMASALE